MKNTDVKIDGVIFKEETDWKEVFRAWYEREGTRAEWQQVAKEKGWSSWDEWRATWAGYFGAQNRKWFRFVIQDPMKTVPLFRVGPTKSWQKNFPDAERNRHTFAELVDRVSYENHGKVRSIFEHFPQPTEFIGILLPDHTIVLIEGHHRAVALAMAAKRGRKMSFTRVPTIALTFFGKNEKNILDDMLNRGSVNNVTVENH